MQLEKHKNKSEAPNYPPPILSSGCEFNCTRNVLFLVYFVCVCVCVCVFKCENQVPTGIRLFIYVCP